MYLPINLLGFLTSYPDIVGVQLALPEICKQYNVDAAVGQWMLTVTYIAQAAFCIPMSKISSMIGQVHMIQLQSSVLLILYTSAMFISNFYALLVVRFILGVLTSGQIACRNMLQKVLFPAQKVQQFIQYNIICINIAQIFIPTIQSVIIEFLGWQYIYIIPAVATCLTIICYLFVENPQRIKRLVSFDIWGCITLFVAVTCLDLSFTVVAEAEYAVFVVMLIIGILVLIIFFFVEKYHADPIVPLHVFKQPLNDMTFLLFSSNVMIAGLNFVMPFYIESFGYSPTARGLVTSVGALLGIILSSTIPTITKKYPNHFCIKGLLGFALLFSIPLPFLLKIFWGTVAIQVLFQIMLSYVGVVINPFMIAVVPQQIAYLVSAIPTTFRTLGNSLSYSLFSMLQQVVDFQLLKQFEQPTDQQKQEAFLWSVMSCHSLQILFAILQFVIGFFRIWNVSSENSKKGFNEKHITDFKFFDDIKQVQMTSSIKEEQQIIDDDQEVGSMDQ